jgi:phage gpG-like protein
MIGCVVKTVGLDKVREAVRRISERQKHPKGFQEYAGAKALRETNKHFINEMGPKGRWEPLKLYTVLGRKGMGSKKKREGIRFGFKVFGEQGGKGKQKILQDSGRLRASIIWNSLSERAIEIFALVKYAATHQYGDSDRNIPARPFLWFPREFKRDIAESFARWVSRGNNG